MTTPSSSDSWLTLKYHFKGWRLLGIYPPTDVDRNWRCLYFLYAIALNLCVTGFFPFTFVVPVFQANNIAEFCERGFIVIPDMLVSLKFVQSWYLFHRLLAIRPSMEYLDRRLKSSSERRCVNDARQFTWRILACIVGLFCCLWVSALPVAFFADGRQLTFHGSFPWDWQRTQLRYIFTNCLQYTGLTIQSIQDILSDSYPLALLSMIGAHIRALGFRVQNIAKNVHIADNRGTHRFRGESTLIKAQRQAEAQAELNTCIEDHKLLLSLLDTIVEIISPICFYQFASTALSVCIMGGFVLFAELDFMAEVNLFFFFAISVMETLMVCTSGELMYQECEQLTTAIYSSQWYNHDVKFQRTLLLMMVRSQKIKEVMAANIVPVRISTFVAVMKGSYSMFTLLCKMDSKG